MAPGRHTVEVAAEDVAGYIATATTTVNVATELPGVSSTQNLPGWQSCSAALQKGYTCAAGLGTATSKLIQDKPLHRWMGLPPSSPWVGLTPIPMSYIGIRGGR